MRVVRSAVVFVFACLAAACSMTQVSSEWGNPQHAAAPPKKILVVAVVPADATRLQLQSELAAKLNHEGLAATPANALLPPEVRPTREQISQLAAQHGFDGVLVARSLGTEQRVVQSPGYYWGGYGWGYPYGFYGGYSGGYWEAVPAERMETTLTDTHRGGLVWAASTSTIKNGSPKGELSRFSAVIAKRLSKQLQG